MDELIKKIDKIIKVKFPDYTQAEIDEMMQDYSEIIFLEVMNKIGDDLGEENSKKFVQLYKAGKSDEALEFANKNGADVEKIFEEASKKVVAHIFS